MIRHPTTLRKRKTIDNALPPFSIYFHLYVKVNATTKISPRKSMHTPHQKYYIPPLYPDKSE